MMPKLARTRQRKSRVFFRAGRFGGRNCRLVSYADFITLLLAFFVVLYASSQVDKRKIGRLALSIQVAFQELGVFETSNTKIPLSDSEAVPFSQVQVVENAERSSDLEHFVQPMKGVLRTSQSNSQMKNLQGELEKALAPEISKHVVEVKATREGIVVRLREIGFYESVPQIFGLRRKMSSTGSPPSLARRRRRCASRAIRTTFRFTTPGLIPTGSFPQLERPISSSFL